jgi:hypothetical protein
MIGFWDMGAKKPPKLPPVEPRGNDTAGDKFGGCLAGCIAFSGVQTGPCGVVTLLNPRELSSADCGRAGRGVSSSPWVVGGWSLRLVDLALPASALLAGNYALHGWSPANAESLRLALAVNPRSVFPLGLQVGLAGFSLGHLMAGFLSFLVIVAIEIAESKARRRLATMAISERYQLSRPLVFIPRFRAIWAVELRAWNDSALAAKP